MRDFLRWVEPSALWGLFFLTSVYGHVALKLAVARAGSSPAWRPSRAASSCRCALR